MALSEWHLTPEYINENWTEELLALMMSARVEKLKRARRVVTDKGVELPGGVTHHKSVEGLINKLTGLGSNGLTITKR